MTYLLIIIFVSVSLVCPPSEGFPGEISMGIQISQSQPELAVHPALPYQLGAPQPSQKGEDSNRWDFKRIFKASGSPMWGGSGGAEGSQAQRQQERSPSRRDTELEQL